MDYLCTKGKTGKRPVVADPFLLSHIPKFKAYRANELSRQNKGLDESEPIFCKENGAPIKSFKKGFEAFLEAYGLLEDTFGDNRVPYSLRHTYAIRMIKYDIKLIDLAHNMGTSIKMLEATYLHKNHLQYGKAIEVFDTDYFSEYQPQFWGFESIEEQDLAEKRGVEIRRARRYKEIMKFVRCEPYDFELDSDIVNDAKIARDLIAEKPSLAEPKCRDELLIAILCQRPKRRIKVPDGPDSDVLSRILNRDIDRENHHILD